MKLAVNMNCKKYHTEKRAYVLCRKLYSFCNGMFITIVEVIVGIKIFPTKLNCTKLFAGKKHLLPKKIKTGESYSCSQNIKKIKNQRNEKRKQNRHSIFFL